MSRMPSEVQKIAKSVLTAKQYEVFDLETRGWGLLRMARFLEISKSAVVVRLDAAHLKLRKAGIEQDGSGNYSLGEGNASSQDKGSPEGGDAR